MASNERLERADRLGPNEALGLVRGVRAEILDQTGGLRGILETSALGEHLRVELAAIDAAVDDLWEAAEGKTEDLLGAEGGRET